MLACGYRAIDALRIEKGYRVWGSDITPEDGPDEAGLGFAVKLDKPGGFIGRDAVVGRPRARAPERRHGLPGAVRPARAVASAQEPVRVGGEVVGRVTTGGFGFAVERSIALRLPAGRRTPRSAPRSRSRCSASGWRRRSPPSRCGTPGASGSAPRAQAAGWNSRITVWSRRGRRRRSRPGRRPAPRRSAGSPGRSPVAGVRSVIRRDVAAPAGAAPRTPAGRGGSRTGGWGTRW